MVLRRRRDGNWGGGVGGAIGGEGELGGWSSTKNILEEKEAGVSVRGGGEESHEALALLSGCCGGKT